MRQVVLVLHARNCADAPAVCDLTRRHVAKADVSDQSLVLQFGQRGERRFERALGGAVDVEHAAEVDDLEHVETKVTQIVVHGLR